MSSTQKYLYVKSFAKLSTKGHTINDLGEGLGQRIPDEFFFLAKRLIRSFNFLANLLVIFFLDGKTGFFSLSILYETSSKLLMVMSFLFPSQPAGNFFSLLEGL